MMGFMSTVEAKKRWCPFARCGGVANTPTYNRDPSSGRAANAAYCLGAGCMAWVQAEEDNIYGRCGLVQRG